MKKFYCVMLLSLLVLPVIGCRTDRLETGYVPNRLGSTETQRKGYYAKPFSREAAEAQGERIDRRPTTGGPMR